MGEQRLGGARRILSRSGQADTLQSRLDELGRETDAELTMQYSLRWPRRPPGLYWQMRWLVGLVVRCLESIRVRRSHDWPVALKQAHSQAKKVTPLLIWGVGTDRDALRRACEELSSHSMPGLAPVLVTDVADFAYFSRLGWLVEYMPRLAGDGEPYETRKERFLARLYSGAPVVSAGEILESSWDPDKIWK